MAAPFPVGTIVWLKSGGPPLTVTDFGGRTDDVVAVEWFAGDVLRRDAFHKDTLKTERTDGRS